MSHHTAPRTARRCSQPGSPISGAAAPSEARALPQLVPALRSGLGPGRVQAPVGAEGPERGLRIPARVGMSGKNCLVIRAAASVEDAGAIRDFLLDYAAAEMAEAPVDPAILYETILHTMTDGAAMMALLDGTLAGYLGIVATPYSYSRERFLVDTGFFVRPEYRGGDVARALLAEARGIADHARLVLKIVDTNVAKRRRPGRAAITAEIIGYRPAGRVFTHHPKVN